MAAPSSGTTSRGDGPKSSVALSRSARGTYPGNPSSSMLGAGLDDIDSSSDPDRLAETGVISRHFDTTAFARWLQILAMTHVKSGTISGESGHGKTPGRVLGTAPKRAGRIGANVYELARPPGELGETTRR